MAAGVFFHWVRVFGVLLTLLSFESLPAAGETRRSHYETLHVDPTATDSQIKKSFRKLALKYHPDKREGADAERRFREIVEAYKVLSDGEKRRLYDISEDRVAFPHDSCRTPADPMDELFTSADLFHGDDCPLFTEQSPHWTVNHFEDEEDYLYDFYSSASYLDSWDENEDLLF